MSDGADIRDRHISNDDGRHFGTEETKASALRQVRTAESLTISPELFEKLYLNPKTPVTGDLRKMIGNPTPV